MSIIVGDETKLVISGLTGREGTFHGSRPATDISHSSGRHALTRVGHDHGQWPGARQE